MSLPPHGASTALGLRELRPLPGSVLWIINDHPRVVERLRARLAAAGLEHQRLVFSPKLESAAFAQAYPLADLLLDTSPYGSGATAVTALSAGVPRLTCPRDSFASRMGTSRPNCSACAVSCSSARATLFDTAAWVGHLESLLERLLVVEREQPGSMDAH